MVVIRLRLDGPPEIEAHGATIAEASQTLKELREAGAFNAVKAIAREYQEAPEAGLESAQKVFPEARVVEEWKAEAPEQLARPEPVEMVSASHPPVARKLSVLYESVRHRETHRSQR